MNEIERKLKEPFKAEQIHWRVGATTKDKSKGIALAYLDARDVMDRLDEAVGAENWTDSYLETESKRVICDLSIKLDGNWISKSDGAGETAVEGDKGGISDAFKRAAVKWGIGRYLYRLGTQWEPLKPQGKSCVLVGSPQLPEWALPTPKPSLEQHVAAFRDNWTSVLMIKEGIAGAAMHPANDAREHLSPAAEAWFELDKDVKQVLWRSTREGGIWTTEERKVMKESLSKYRGENNNE